MFKLHVLVLITLIAGVFTRGVPSADDTNVEHKRTETDHKDHSSEHVTLTECKDCTKINGKGEQRSDVSVTSDIRGNDQSYAKASPQTPKPRTNSQIKPFLAFHRIRVNVDRDRGNTDRDIRKYRRRHHHHHKLRANKPESKQAKDGVARNQSTYIRHKVTSKPREANENKNRKDQFDEKKPNIQETNVQTFGRKPEANILINEKTAPISKMAVEDSKSREIIKNNVTINQEAITKVKDVNDNFGQVMMKQEHEKTSTKQKEVNSDNEKTQKTTLEDVRKSGKSNEPQNDEKTSVQSTEKPNDKKKIDKSTEKQKDEKISDKSIEKQKDEKISDKSKENQKDDKISDKLKQKRKDEKKPDKSREKTKDENKYVQLIEKQKDEKDSVNHIIPERVGDRWSRKGLSQVPDVERLERRLHPTVDAPVQDIIQSMKNMLTLIRSSLQTVDNDYKMIQNTTRWKYMVGVRDHLSELAEKNDQIYDVVMETALLTKEIYRKAHERRHPRVNVEALAISERSKLNTNMHTKMHSNYFAAQQELDEANKLLEKIKASRKQKESLLEEKMHLLHFVGDRLPLRAMHDLNRRANQTIQMLLAAQPLSRNAEKPQLYAHMKNDTFLNMRRARELTVEGFDILEHAKRVLMENKMKAQEHGKIIRGIIPEGVIADMPFDSGRMDSFVASMDAKQHLETLSARAREIHMRLDPLIKKAKEVMASRKSAGFQKILDRSVDELKSNVKTLLDALDHIRLIIGDAGVITEHCEVLQRARFFRGSLIPCDDYIDGSGEGSGEFDDTIVDMEMSGLSLPNITSEESGVDIDITEGKTTDNGYESKKEDPAPVINLDDIDDEDIARELKIKLTQKTTPYTTTPPTTTTTTAAAIVKTTTASASSEDSDDDLFFNVWGIFSDQPDGESIVIDAEDNIGILSAPESKTLNELIRERLYNYSQHSEELLESAEKKSSNMKEISLTWQKLQTRVASLENKTLHAVSLVSKWKANRSYFNAVHDRIEGLAENTKLRKEVVDTQCSDAIETANKKLGDMTNVYKARLEKAQTAADPTDVVETVDQVKTVVDNVKKIASLKQLYPSPCNMLESLDRKIRTNITELKKKIERAKLIASSLQIAVAVPKNEFLEFPISKESQGKHPLTSQIQVMLKHSGSNGKLVSLHVGKSESVALEMKDDALTVVQSVDSDEKRMSLYEDSIADQWYLIQLQRFAASYNVTMFGDNGVLGQVGTSSSVDDIKAMTPDLLSATLRLGASGDLEACASGLEINGQSVNIFDMGNDRSIPTLCSSQGRWASTLPHLLLDGSGYASISFSDLPSVRTLRTVKMSFTPRSDGTVVSLQSKQLANVVDVYVEKGFLIVYVSYRNFETKLKTTVQVYSSDHVLEIIFKDGRSRSVDVILNGKSNVFEISQGKKRDLKVNQQYILIGGIPMDNRSMVGCVKSLELNGEVIPFNSLYEAEGTRFGTCQNINCIMLDDNSIPIDFEDRPVLQSIHFAVKSDSLGPILTYSKHKEKFNILVSLNTEGLSIEETVKDKTEDISLDDDSEFIVVSIQDDTDAESVIVTVGDTIEKFSYKKGGWGWGNGGDKEEDPISYSVSLGSSSDDSPPFLGTIQNFILDGRPIDLLKYLETNKLGRCTVDPAPRKLKAEENDTRRIMCQ